jgi:hypothetical protein
MSHPNNPTSKQDLTVHAARLRDMAEQVPSMGPRTRAALLAGAEALEQAAWQPIETAPKDGRGFLAWNESLRIVEITWWRENMAGITHWRPLPDGPMTAALARLEGE